MRARKGARRTRQKDTRQLDLLDWLDAQPSFAPQTAKPRPRPQLVAGRDVDEDQLDLVELIATKTKAA